MKRYPKTRHWRLLAIGSACLVLSSAVVSAQQYTIPWSKIAGGGTPTPSTGGVYAVCGTLGQSDAGGPLTGGAYSITGGFWPGVNAVQTPGAPLLASELLTGGSVRVFWPLPANGYVLDQTTTLGATPPATEWSQVPFPYQTNATRISVTVPPGVGSRFYRLRKQ